MKTVVLVFLLVGLFTSNISAQSTAQPFEVIAYYTGDGDLISNYPVEKLTHIIYSFLHLKGDTIAFDRDEQKETLRKLVALKQTYPRLKVMISLGGWSACPTCSDVFSSAESRRNFAVSVLNVCQQFGADGIDLDWEYPAIEGYPGHAYKPEDKENFTELLRELNQQLWPNYELSFAAGGFTRFLENSIDWEAAFPLVNRVNLMTYDLVGGYDTVTGHHTALYSNSQQQQSTDNCVKWLLSRGYPSEKLLIGAAFYGRTWEKVANVNEGKYQPGRFKSFVDYKISGTLLSADSGWVKYWDETSHAPYAYNSSKQLYATYDDKRSLADKVAYAKSLHLGGIMFWELKSDVFKDGLLDAIDKAIRQ